MDDDTLTTTCPCCRSTVTFREADEMPVEVTLPDDPRTLTAYSLSVLLHYFSSAEPHAHERHFGTGTRGLFETCCTAFIQAGLLTTHPRAGAARAPYYILTEAGTAWIRALLATPRP